MSTSRVRSSLRRDLARILGGLMKALVALVCCFAIGPSPALAHPHAWIDLRSTVVLDVQGHVTAIEQEWLFDEFYTVFATEEVSSEARAQDAALTALARSNLQNLRPYDYFTEVRAGDAKVALSKVSEFETELREGRLWMRFVVPLTTPVDPTRQALAFSVFDPTYYIAILHTQNDVIAFRGSETSDCFGRVVPPNPSTEAVELAQAMDRDAAPDSTLGKIFAERVEVTCP